jgi:hypothetical protein
VLQDLRMPEMISKLQRTLVSGVTDVADFRGLIFFPLLVMELHVKLLQVVWMSKIYKCISNIAVMLNKKTIYIFVDGKVKEIKFILIVHRKLLK